MSEECVDVRLWVGASCSCQRLLSTRVGSVHGLGAELVRERGARALEERLNMKKAAAAGRATVATDVEAGHQAPASDS